MHTTHRYIHKYDCASNFTYSYSFTQCIELHVARMYTQFCGSFPRVIRGWAGLLQRLGEGVGFRISVRAGDYPPKREDRLCDTSSCLFSGYPDLFPGVKRPGRDVDHSPPFGVVFENEWVCTTAFHPVSLSDVSGTTLPPPIFDIQRGGGGGTPAWWCVDPAPLQSWAANVVSFWISRTGKQGMESYKESFVKLPLLTPGRKWVDSSLLRGSSGECNNPFLWRPVAGKGRKGEDRIHTRKAYGRNIGIAPIVLYLNWGECWTSCHGRFAPGKKRRCQLNRRLNVSQRRSGRFGAEERPLSLPGLELPIVHPVS